MVFRILSSKLDRKLNHPRRARTTLRSKVNIYGTIIRRVYGEYTITSFLSNFGACANIRYRAAFLPSPSRPGYEATILSARPSLAYTCFVINKPNMYVDDHFQMKMVVNIKINEVKSAARVRACACGLVYHTYVHEFNTWTISVGLAQTRPNNI